MVLLQNLSVRLFGIFLLLILLVVTIQSDLLRPHLKYGFGDMDWVFLLRYKSLGDHPFSVENLAKEWRESGVYTYQTYYIGLQENLFGLDFKKYHQTTQFFKILATISLFPLILMLTGRKLVAFLATLVYAIAFPPVGVMYLVVTSGLHMAIFIMNLFLLLYLYVVKKNIVSWKILGVTLFLFLLTLFLSTERMYPLIPLIILTELTVLWHRQFRKMARIGAIKRLSVFLLPIFLTILIKPYVVTQFFGNTGVIFRKIIDGNWQLMLTPFASLGSMFLPGEYLRVFGPPVTSSLRGYLEFILGGPTVVFGVLTILLALILAKKRLQFIATTVFLFSMFSLIVFFLSVHRLTVSESLRVHFDNSIIPAVLIGAYVLSFSVAIFREWQSQKNHLLLGIFLGITVAFLFIFMTWVPSDYVLVFVGVHRYLTIPAIGTSLFLACLLALTYDKLRSLRFIKYLAWMVFLVLIPIAIINGKVINDYFKSELTFTGMDGAAQTRMKNKLWSYLDNFSDKESSLFYFDESADIPNGYFHETTLLAGFNFWMRFRGREIVRPELTPQLLRSNHLCLGSSKDCIEKVAELVQIQDGNKGILYQGKFYKAENFYGFRLKNKEVINITDEVKQRINL